MLPPVLLWQEAAAARAPMWRRAWQRRPSPAPKVAARRQRLPGAQAAIGRSAGLRAARS